MVFKNEILLALPEKQNELLLVILNSWWVHSLMNTTKDNFQWVGFDEK